MARVARLLLVVALLAVPAGAEVFTVSLHNGSSFDTLYRPEEAPWDANKVLLRTHVGNWVSVAKADIASVVSQTEVGGFGIVINNSTIELGMSANDAPTPEQLAEQAKANPLGALQDQIQSQQSQPYSIQQFVEPSQTQGLPGQWVGYGQSTPQIAVPIPQPR